MENNLLKTSIGRLRLVGLIEGISFLVLLGIAMPLKYMYAMPLAVRIVGSLHGALFIVYMYALLQVMMERKWNIARTATAFISSLLPFGTFVFDAQLKKEQALL